MAMLEVKNIGISFGGLKAVDNFSLTIEKGQLYGLIGPNGAGKTTIFNLLTGVYKADHGSIFLDGKELNLAEEYSDPDLVSMRNVAGEIKGAELAMAYCLTHDIPELAIYHDYQGIASWCTREWQAKKQGTIDYRNFYDLASAKVAIRFCKVKGHTGVTYNEKADQLAKQALGL